MSEMAVMGESCSTPSDQMTPIPDQRARRSSLGPNLIMQSFKEALRKAQEPRLFFYRMQSDEYSSAHATSDTSPLIRHLWVLIRAHTGP